MSRKGGNSASPTNKTQQVQGEVDDVIVIMQDNIEKVVQRGERLETLQTKTDDLQHGALQFKKGANTARKQMWWKDMKMKMILAGVICLIILVIVIGITVH